MRLLLQSQLRNLKKKPKGRRWTLEEKLFFVSLYKQSPHTYVYMKPKFNLPSRQTLLSVQSSVPFEAGINPGVITHLSSCASQMSDCDKYCVLLFDEISIKPSLLYNPRSDRLVGFEDHGSRGRSCSIAREALVFMVRSLKQKWKQPVAFYFSERYTPGLILAELIKEVLDSLQNTGLKIVATVCDMGSNNTMALKCLGYSALNPYFYFNEQRIFTLHDPPHLLICIRNMFLKHPIKGQALVGGKMFSGIGRWSHIKSIFDISIEMQNCAVAHASFMPKITEAHLNPKGRQKMSMKLAANVFSEKVVGMMEMCRILKNMSLDICVTTSFLRFIHKLFNSINGVKSEENSKVLTSCLSEGSAHLDFWNDALSTINNWVFLKDDVSYTENPRYKGTLRSKSKNGWIITIRAIKLLWEELQKTGFNMLEPRRLNLDPLENFFGSIRLHSGANRNPSVEQFASAVKTSFIRNISSQLLQYSNCASDGDVFIADLKEFIELIPSFQEDTGEVKNATTDDLVDEMSVLDEVAPHMWSAESCTRDMSLTKSCCKILKALLRNSTCSTCISLLTANPSVFCENFVSSEEALQIEGRIYYPSERFVNSVRLALDSLEGFITHNKTTEGIGRKGKSAISNVFSWLHCEDHEIGERTAKMLVRYALLDYCRNATKGL